MKGSMITVLMVTGALGAGSSAAYFANAYIDRSVQQRRAEIDSQYATAKVVVANADLRPGTFLSGETVAVRVVKAGEVFRRHRQVRIQDGEEVS